MLGFAACDSGAPAPKCCWFQMCAHQLNDVSFGELKLMLDRLKGGSILPGHLDDAALICGGDVFIHGTTMPQLAYRFCEVFKVVSAARSR